ncbi:hypothetical protein TL16_g12751 [Triparma laevis f. inornata]|uniref:Uncharacterized protein n=1 Tax=Triparma laevis f. inornata TaxID=1714386 RepID=A0A9W7BNY3_9STRA|nr:hypothetical protein TL16_g12751 [Triparma laevis f. inornata]
MAQRMLSSIGATPRATLFARGRSEEEGGITREQSLKSDTRRRSSLPDFLKTVTKDKREGKKLTEFGKWYRTHSRFYFKNRVEGDEGVAPIRFRDHRRQLVFKEKFVSKGGEGQTREYTAVENLLIENGIKRVESARESLKEYAPFPIISYLLEYDRRSSSTNQSRVFVDADLSCSAEELVAYRFDEELWGHSGSKMTVFDETPHSYKTMVVLPLGGFFQERELLMFYCWKKVSETMWVITGEPVVDERYPINDKAVRGQFYSTMVVYVTSPTSCSVKHCMSVDVVLPLPRFIMKGKSMEEAEWVAHIKVFFVAHKSKDNMGNAEGGILGEYFARGFKGTSDWEKVNTKWQEAIEEFRCMNEMIEVYPWFEKIVKHVLINRLVPWQPCGKCLDDVQVDDAERVGKSLPFFVTMRSDPDMALNEWLLEFPCMTELGEREPWFGSFMLALARRLGSGEGGILRRQSLAFCRRQESVMPGVSPRLSIKGSRVQVPRISTMESDNHVIHVGAEGNFIMATMQKFLGVPGGKSKMNAAIFFGYLVPAIVFILPLNNAWLGADENTMFLFVIAPIILFFGSQLLMGVCSAAFKVFLICEDLPYREAHLYRAKFAIATYLALAIPVFIVFWAVSFKIIFPVPWAVLVTLFFTPLCVVVTYFFVKYTCKNPKHLIQPNEFKRFLLIVIFVIPFVAILPLSTGFYILLKGYKQLALVTALSSMRFLEVFGIEWLGLGKVNELTILVLELVIDVFYETHAATLFSGADLGITLAFPPLLDLLGNLGTMAYIYYFQRHDKNAQTLSLIALATREIVEISTSLGVTVVFGSIWLFRKEHYFMIDTVEQHELERAFTMSLIDFLTEIVVLLLFDRVVYSVWRVHLYDLAQAFARAIGFYELFGMICGCVIFILTFLMYHFGGDYFMNFEWMEMDDFDGWCAAMQRNASSCYRTTGGWGFIND